MAPSPAPSTFVLSSSIEHAILEVSTKGERMEVEATPEMKARSVVVYCDSRSDEILAADWLTGAGFDSATILPLPRGQRNAPPALRRILEWERLDWLIVVDGKPVCGVELSRHGYTGDNSFQRFARVYRCADLGVPVIYFTSFSRTRLNEIEDGRLSPRNVAPELFLTLASLSKTKGVPCVAVDWPTGADGTPLPLRSPAARPALQRLTDLVTFFTEKGNTGDNSSLEGDFPDVLAAMKAQASLAFTGSETRGTVNLPIDPTKTKWVTDWLPSNYFSTGKADKALAALALNAVSTRNFVPNTSKSEQWWTAGGTAQVLYLGYQWRPDPACGLIALSSTLAQASGRRLIVVWPRLYYSNSPARQASLDALTTFAESGNGSLLAQMRSLGYDATKIADFQARVSTNENQYGKYSQASKVGRILKQVADLVVFGDSVVVP